MLRSISRVNTPPSVSDAKGKRRHVEKQATSFHVTAQHCTLNRGTDRHDLIGVDVAGRLLAEELLHDLDDLRHAGHAADQDHLVQLAGRDAGILQSGAAGRERPLDEVIPPGSRASRATASAPECFGPEASVR